MKNGNGQDNVEVTNNDLARMIAEGFSGVDEQFKEVRMEFTTEIGGVKDRLKNVEAKLDKALYTEYVSLETRVRRVEKKVGINP